jgi:hypothetical protein
VAGGTQTRRNPGAACTLAGMCAVNLRLAGGCCFIAAMLAAYGQAQTPGGQPVSATAVSQGDWKVSPQERAPYVPLGLKKKAYLFGYRAVEPTGLGKSLFTAGLAQLQNSPEEWGQGMAGFGRRYGHRLATRGVETGIGFGVAALLRQDGRYFRLSEGSVGERIGHSLRHTMLTRTDSGGRTFAVWRLVGNYGAQFVSNAWRPASENRNGDALVRGTISIGYDAASNIFKEFWPDIRRKLLKR